MPAPAPKPHRSLTVTLRLPAGLSLAENDVQDGVAALLFHDGKLSHKEACDLLGKDRCGFDEVLAAHGFSPSDGIEPLADFPYLEREDVMQALQYAAWLAEEREVSLAIA